MKHADIHPKHGSQPAGCNAGLLLVLVVISLAVVGCRTLNYTQEDLERERSLLAENMAKVQQGGWGCGGGVGIRPDLSKINLGNIGCPNLGPGVCPGK